MREETLFAVNTLVLKTYKLLTVGRKQTMEMQIRLKRVLMEARFIASSENHNKNYSTTK